MRVAISVNAHVTNDALAPQPPMKFLPINTSLHTTTSMIVTLDLLFVVSLSPPLHTNTSGRVVESWLRQEHYAIDIQVSLFLGCLDDDIMRSRCDLTMGGPILNNEKPQHFVLAFKRQPSKFHNDMNGVPKERKEDS